MTADVTTLAWRCVWRSGALDLRKDFDTEDAAERHKTWVERKNGEVKHPIVAQVYAIRIWPEEVA